MPPTPKYDPLRKIDTREQYVVLECLTFECKYSPDRVSTLIPRDNYVHGSYKCDKCGTTLTVKNIVKY